MMKKEEAIALKLYIQGAYPQMKDNIAGDESWKDILRDYDAKVMLKVVKEYIRSGNEYPPNLGTLCKGYEDFQNLFFDEVLERIIVDGHLNDPDGTDSEISDWNFKNRKQKCKMWIQNKNSMPEWFKEIYDKYRRETYDRLMSNNVQLLE